MREEYNPSVFVARVAAVALLLAGCGDRGDAGGTGGGSITTTTVGTMSAGTGSTDSSGSASGGGTGGDKFDIYGSDLPGGPGDCTAGGGTGGGGDVEFSYIWIANSPQGSVSKIDTRTATEVARYYTNALIEQGDPNTGPSRTSVNLYGDAAVSNRNGGVTKIAARLEDCVDLNANGTIDTSTGPADIRPWGQDECVLWHYANTATVYNEGPRPTAWEGKITQGCAAPNPNLWVGWYSAAGNTGIFERLDGANGSMIDHVEVPNWGSGGAPSWGPYGGATDKDGNFWVTGWQTMGPLVKIDTNGVDYEYIPNPGGQFYGMALDADGNPWVATLEGVAFKYNRATSSWQYFGGGDVFRGIQIDRNGKAWIASNGGNCIVELDVATGTILGSNPALGCSQPVGVSIDVDGYVWLVDQTLNGAFKIDPATRNQIAFTSGLISPYTYSDMTGAGLNLVTNPPQG
jgi:streptogramin lyase